MKMVVIGALLLLSVGTAHAQINLWGDDGRKRDPEAEAKQQEIDKAYKAKLQSVPAQAPAADPWGNVRNTQPAQGKPQSGSKNR